MINYLLLLSALCITSVSGYISIIGLTSIFSSPSSFYVIVAIASAFEVGKILLTVWLEYYWTAINFIFRFYLVSIVVILILLNAISSFGFLSKSHIEETLHISSGGSDQKRLYCAQI